MTPKEKSPQKSSRAFHHTVKRCSSDATPRLRAPSIAEQFNQNRSNAASTIPLALPSTPRRPEVTITGSTKPTATKTGSLRTSSGPESTELGKKVPKVQFGNNQERWGPATHRPRLQTSPKQSKHRREEPKSPESRTPEESPRKTSPIKRLLSRTSSSPRGQNRAKISSQSPRVQELTRRTSLPERKRDVPRLLNLPLLERINGEANPPLTGNRAGHVEAALPPRPERLEDKIQRLKGDKKKLKQQLKIALAENSALKSQLNAQQDQPSTLPSEPVSGDSTTNQ